MKTLNRLIITIAVLFALPLGAGAQTTYTENFTGVTTTNSWYYINGACLTAGNLDFSLQSSPGHVPSCASMIVGSGYYNQNYAVNSAGMNPEPLVGGSSGTIPGADGTNGGALRFTNYPTIGSYPQGFFESGAILSNFTFPLASQGIQITFVTETYEGNKGGTGADGADGISFFLQDAGTSANPITPDLGATGGSLAYSCSNSNNDPTTRASGQPRGFDGITGGYIGLGIDEYGNFLNAGDNTATGYGYRWNRIGLRGAGSVAWNWLNTNYPAYYPSSLSYAQRASAVQATCASGVVMQYNPANGGYGNAVAPAISVPDYPALSYHLLDTLQPGIKIANEKAIYRGNGTPAQTGDNWGVPISYNLTITTGGLLSLSYSYDGGASVSVITGQNITTSNGNLPALVRFGFAGSDGGATNIHEIMCFQAAPQTSAASSAAGNQKQSAPVEQGTQVYFSFYNPTNWSGSVTSDSVLLDSSNNVYLNPVYNWDANCQLSGLALNQKCASTGVTATSGAIAPQSSRTMLTWNNASTGAGIPFEWANLTSNERSALDTGDSPTGQQYRLNYLRGDRTGEQNSTGGSGITGVVYRARSGVLGDIIDSSPTWVGPPLSKFPAVWSDYIATSTTPTPMENSGQTYSAYATALNSRMNVVYAGANDGFLHGFRAGYYVNGAYQGTGTGASFVGINNDGSELLAYMPGYTLNNIQTTSSAYNYSDVQYAHAFDVDATPGTGDLFYQGAWHTWLVGGLGPGGPDIFALDVTNPQDSTVTAGPLFNELNAGTIVIGDWTTTMSCTSVANSSQSASTCGLNLGNTYGTPVIRRFHNGSWGVVFGNGFGSSTGEAGIFIFLVDPTSGTSNISKIYLGTGSSVTGDGIAYVSPVDLDGDHITDYVYAGDLKGNVWRFDVTSNNTSNWAVTKTGPTSGSPMPLFNAGQPITSQIDVVTFYSSPATRIMLEFGTGQVIPQTPASAAVYLTAQQGIYGIWDWDMNNWNSLSTTKYDAATLSAGVAASSLAQQGITSLTLGGVDYRSLTSNPVCWPGLTTCGATQYGWYLPLISGHANANDVNLPTPTGTSPMVYEQVLYNPILSGDILFLNTTIPSATSLTNCFSANAGGYTLALNPATGGAFKNTVYTAADGTTSNNLSGVALSGTGTPFFVNNTPCTGPSCINPPPPQNCNAAVKTWLITQTVSGTAKTIQPNMQCNVSATRPSWIQRR